MNKFISGFLCLMILAAGGTLLYSRLQPSLESNEPVFRAVQNDPSDDLQTEEAAPYVNKQRLIQMAGQPYQGMHYAATKEEINQLIAESKMNHASGNRLPANAVPEKQEPAKKKKNK